MIKQGDRFTSLDLQQSMREVCGYDMQRYINKKQSNAIVLIANYAIAPGQCTPDEYAAVNIQAYGDIKSSAQFLDQQLRDKGFKTAYKFSYKYRSGGLTPEQIVHDAYCLDWFQQIYNFAAPRAQYQEKYFKALEDAFRLTYYYAQYLWAGNPRDCGAIARALRVPDVEQWPQIISAILGIGFQFHPADVYEHAINHINPTMTEVQFDARYAEQLMFKKEMHDNYGIDTGCLVLSQKNRDKLRKIVTRTDTPYYIQVIKNLFLGRVR